jgi:hypothetical protein
MRDDLLWIQAVLVLAWRAVTSKRAAWIDIGMAWSNQYPCWDPAPRSRNVGERRAATFFKRSQTFGKDKYHSLCLLRPGIGLSAFLLVDIRMPAWLLVRL